MSTSAPASLTPVRVEAHALIAFVALKTGKQTMIVFSLGSLKATSEFRSASPHPEVPEQLLAVLKSPDLTDGEYRLPICLAEDAESMRWYVGSPLDAVLTMHAAKPDHVQYIDLSVGSGNCLSLVPQRNLGQPVLATV